MKKLTRILALALCCAFLLGTASFAADSPSSWASAEVNAAISEGLVPAELQKNYTQPVTRGAVAQMFVNLLEKSSGKTSAELLAARGAQIDRNAFTDTTDEAVLVCNALGLINGVGDGRFDPNGTLTRAQIAAIMNRTADVLGFSTENYPHGFTDTKGSWVDSELGWVQHVGIISGVGGSRFDPNGKLTTEQAILITHRALKSTTEVVWRKVKAKVLKIWGEDSTEQYVWEYDEHGNNTAQIKKYGDRESKVTYTYNAYGNPLSSRDGYDAFDKSYTYYEDGNVKSMTLRTLDGYFGDGYTTYYEYIMPNSPKLSPAADADSTVISYEYDSGRRLVKMTKKYSDSASVTEYIYNGDRLTMERITEIDREGGSNVWRTITYSDFDALGNAQKAEYDRGGRISGGRETINYTYDEHGNATLEQIIADGSVLWECSYEYEPVKKASLPMHWAGANDDIYPKTIG